MAKSSKKLWKNGIVIYANHYEFSDADIFHFPMVQSRCLIYCHSGRGELHINNEVFQVEKGDFFFTPWNHTISYLPNTEHPYLLSNVHIIPDFPEMKGKYFVPFHSPMPQYDEYLERKDETLPGFENLFRATLSEESPIIQLMRYIIKTFVRQCPEELLRNFVPQLLYELNLLKNSRASDIPSQALQLIGAIDRFIENDDVLTYVTENTGISISTIFRVMRKCYNMTPGQYIRQRRLKIAARLLRETTLNIANISNRLHFCDQFYFSKLFKAEFGCPPLQYRKRVEGDENTDVYLRESLLEDVIHQNFDRTILHETPKKGKK